LKGKSKTKNSTLVWEVEVDVEREGYCGTKKI